MKLDSVRLLLAQHGVSAALTLLTMSGFIRWAQGLKIQIGDVKPDYHCFH